MESGKSVLSNRPKDCLPCRLISGFGVTGIGVYVWKQATSMKRGYGQLLMYSFALGAVGLGTARLLDLPPFTSLSHGQPPS